MNLAHLFAGAEHQPFRLEQPQAAAEGGPAALLVHGFPGTPAEMRPLGNALHQVGWTVHGPLLPGFGPQVDSLPERRHQEWLAAVTDALVDLQRRHRPVMLAGFSMGASLSLGVAAGHAPEGLVLMAPFWKLPGPLWSILPLLRRVVPRIKPFRLIKLDLSDPQTRQGMMEFMPGLNPDDPQVQQAIRDFALPVGMFDELRLVGKQAWQQAGGFKGPTLVIQGQEDPLVTSQRTRRLLQRLQGTLHYQEVAGAHDLVDASKPAWSTVEQAILQFAQELTHGVSSPAAPGQHH